MGDVLKLPPSLLEDHEFLVTMARYAEGGLTEKQVRKKYRLPDDV
jgi:hypothetical protein